MREFILQRSGQRPLKFTGQLISEVSPRQLDAKKSEKRREYWIALYQTQSGKYVISIEYRTQWDDETPRFDAVICETAKTVALKLEEFDPLAPVVGFPPGTQFEAKQARLLSSIRSEFARQVTELLAQLPDAAEEIN